jgi:hypothetical protein
MSPQRRRLERDVVDFDDKARALVKCYLDGRDIPIMLRLAVEIALATRMKHGETPALNSELCKALDSVPP